MLGQRPTEAEVTENEKLRALLAEARLRIAPCVQAPCTNDGCCLRSRIDAALAEPVESDPPKPPEWACYNCGSMGDFSPIQYAAGDYDIECANCGSKNTDEAGNVIRRLVLDLDEARAERDEARAVLSALCAEFDGTVAHADWRADGSKGMHVPFTGDFASAVQLPSVVSRMRWWVREMRKTLGGTR